MKINLKIINSEGKYESKDRPLPNKFSHFMFDSMASFEIKQGCGRARKVLLGGKAEIKS